MIKEFAKYYYYALSPRKRLVYEAIYKGLKDKEELIHIEDLNEELDADIIMDVFTSVYNDMPSFYYVRPASLKIGLTGYGYDIYPEYIYSIEEIEDIDKTLCSYFDKFMQTNIHRGMSEYEKVLAIHDFIIKRTSYDFEALEGIKNNQSKDEAFSIIGVFAKRRAVCWGISSAVKALCDYCEIRSIVVIGDTLPREEDVRHAWNIGKIGEEYYHLDATFDIKQKGDISFCYDYFNLSDVLMGVDHSWDRDFYPKCQGREENYYYKNKLFVKTREELLAHIENKLKGNESYIAVKYASEDMLDNSQLDTVITGAFLKLGRAGAYSYCVSDKTHNIYIEIK